MTTRYDTFVVKNMKSETIPREIDGMEVTAWTSGHALRQVLILEEFIDDLASGMYAHAPEDLEIEAGEILARSRAARDTEEDWT